MCQGPGQDALGRTDLERPTQERRPRSAARVPLMKGAYTDHELSRVLATSRFQLEMFRIDFPWRQFTAQLKVHNITEWHCHQGL